MHTSHLEWNMPSPTLKLFISAALCHWGHASLLNHLWFWSGISLIPGSIPSSTLTILHFHLLLSTTMIRTGQNVWHRCITICLSSWQVYEVRRDCMVLLPGPEQASESRIIFDAHRSLSLSAYQEAWMWPKCFVLAKTKGINHSSKK